MEVFMKKDKKNRVLAYMAKWWYLYLIGFAAMFLAIYLDMKGPQVTQSIIDDVIVDGQVWIDAALADAFGNRLRAGHLRLCQGIYF